MIKRAKSPPSRSKMPVVGCLNVQVLSLSVRGNWTVWAYLDP